MGMMNSANIMNPMINNRGGQLYLADLQLKSQVSESHTDFGSAIVRAILGDLASV